MWPTLISIALAAALTGGSAYAPPVSGNFTDLDLLPIESTWSSPTNTLGPKLSAQAALAFDAQSGQILFSKNPDTRLPIASLTKLMTAIVITEAHGNQEIVKVFDKVGTVEGTTIPLSRGEKITVENLLKGMLIASGNDAAYALAYYHSDDIEDFADEMNRKADILGLSNTHFQNPAGFDDSANYSSAYDLYLLVNYALKNPIINSIVRTHVTQISSANERIFHKLISTNLLFQSYLPITGIKTGTTEQAGQCLIARLPVGETEITTIVLGSEDRYTDSKLLLDWAIRAYLSAK